MKTAIALLALSLAACHAQADTLMLDIGPGTDYNSHWCGGQTINAVADGWNGDGTAQVYVQVSARCSTGGRGTTPKTYTSCWNITIDRDSTISSKVVSGCTMPDPSVVYVDTDGALLSTSKVVYYSGSQRTGYRAFRTIP